MNPPPISPVKAKVKRNSLEREHAHSIHTNKTFAVNQEEQGPPQGPSSIHDFEVIEKIGK